MRAVVQRVKEAAVTIQGQAKSAIGPGMLVLVGIEAADGPGDITWLAGKLVRLRIFNDAEGMMNRSLLETDGGLLAVSQFTLFAGTRKGNRPSFIRAARPESARPLYDQFVRQLEQELGRPVQTGEFGAAMQVSLINDGPVTLLLDSKEPE